MKVQGQRKDGDMMTELWIEALLWSEGLMKKHTPKILVGRLITVVIVTLMIEVVEYQWVTLQVIYHGLSVKKSNH